MHVRIVVLMMAASLGAVWAADPPPAAFPDAVREAVKNRLIQDTDTPGINSARASHRELVTDGGVLVGFEIGLARFFDKDIPYTLQPIYRDGNREWAGTPAGNPASRLIKHKVKIVAKPDYAVGGVWTRTGGNIDRLCINFFRIRDGGLDPSDSYPSEWIGTSNRGTEKYLDGRGRPIVGLFADAPGDQARNLGLIFARVPPAPKKTDLSHLKLDLPNPTEPKPTLQPGEKSKLELEAEARKVQDETPEPPASSMSLLPFYIAGAMGLPVAMFGLYFLVRKGNGPSRTKEDRDFRSDQEFESQPLSERPALARRLEPYLRNKAGRKRRPVRLDADAAPNTAELLEARESIPCPVVGAIQAAVALPTPPPDDLPQFFQVRSLNRAQSDQTTRIYVLEDEMLVIDAGREADMEHAAGLAVSPVDGDRVGSMPGSTGASLMENGQPPGVGSAQLRLDQLDVNGLLECAGENGNFRVRFEDVVGLAIDPPPPPSFWREKTRAVGTFRFRHLERGELAFEFFHATEIRAAIEMFRRSSGADQLHVGNGWDSLTSPYLADL